MVKISILYPNRPGSRFDMDYYLHTHMPMSIERLSVADGFVSVTVEQGVSGPEPGSPPAFVAMCDYQFETLEAFMAAFMPHAELLQGDIPNYTDVAPEIQINEIMIAR